MSLLNVTYGMKRKERDDEVIDLTEDSGDEEVINLMDDLEDEEVTIPRTADNVVAASRVRNRDYLSDACIDAFCEHVLEDVVNVVYIRPAITDIQNNWNGAEFKTAMDKVCGKQKFAEAMGKFVRKEVGTVVIPFHNPLHWLLIVIVRKSEVPVTYVVNSLPESSKDVYTKVATIFSTQAGGSGFTMAVTKHQADGTSCGLFTMLYVEAVANCVKDRKDIDENSFSHITQEVVEGRREGIAVIVSDNYFK